MSKTFETDFETIREVVRPILEAKDKEIAALKAELISEREKTWAQFTRAEKAESRVAEATAILKRFVKTGDPHEARPDARRFLEDGESDHPSKDGSHEGYEKRSNGPRPNATKPVVAANLAATAPGSGTSPSGVSPSPPPFISKMCRAGEFPLAANQAALHLRCHAKTCSCRCHYGWNSAAPKRKEAKT